MNPPKLKELPIRGAGAHQRLGPASQVWPDLGSGQAAQFLHGALGNDLSAAGPGLRTHLHDPVRLGENLGVVVHQQHRIAIRHQIVHHGGQPVDVGGMQANGGLVQHIQHPGGAVADRAGQLHPLALAGGEGGGGTVQGEVAQPQFHQAAGCSVKRVADALCHGAHLLRQGVRNSLTHSARSLRVILQASSRPIPPQPGGTGLL